MSNSFANIRTTLANVYRVSFTMYSTAEAANAQMVQYLLEYKHIIINSKSIIANTELHANSVKFTIDPKKVSRLVLLLRNLKKKESAFRTQFNKLLSLIRIIASDRGPTISGCR